MSRTLLLVTFIALAGALGGPALAEDAKPFDFKPLLPPVLPPVLPPNSQVQSGSVGGTQTPYTTAPLQNTAPSPTQSAPGVRFSIPSR
jgi:hypothetical protein